MPALKQAPDLGEWYITRVETELARGCLRILYGESAAGRRRLAGSRRLDRRRNALRVRNFGLTTGSVSPITVSPSIAGRDCRSIPGRSAIRSVTRPALDLDDFERMTVMHRHGRRRDSRPSSGPRAGSAPPRGTDPPRGPMRRRARPGVE